MEDPRRKIAAIELEDPRCKNLLSGVEIEKEDPRCKNLHKMW
jgi:phage FluMu protein Com